MIDTKTPSPAPTFLACETRILFTIVSQAENSAVILAVSTAFTCSSQNQPAESSSLFCRAVLCSMKIAWGPGVAHSKHRKIVKTQMHQ